MQPQQPPNRKIRIIISLIGAVIALGFVGNFFWPLLKDIGHAHQNGKSIPIAPLLIFGGFALMMVLFVVLNAAGSFRKASGSKPSAAAGGTGGIGATIFLILFATPFAGFGLLALVQGIRKISTGNMKDGPMLCLFGLVFSGVGFGLMTLAIWMRKKSKRTAALQARFPDQPWMLRPDWADGKIKSSALAQPLILLVMGLMFCVIGGVSTVFALPDVWQKHNYAALVVLLFPLAGIVMLAAFVVGWRSQKRFGKCFFEPAQIPTPLGGVLEGMIQTGKPLTLEHELNLKFSCVRRVTTGSGKSSSTNEYVLWHDEKAYSEQAALPQTGAGTGIPVHFKLPADQPECYSRANESVLWRLEAKSKLRGPDFRAAFEVPVFKIAGAAIAPADETDADAADPTAALQAPIEEIRRDENSKIKISDGPGGREFYFPAARNIGTALFMTLGMLIFNGIAIATSLGHAPVLFPIAFGLIGILLMLGAFNMWFKSSRVTINPTTVRVISRWLIFSRAHEFSAGDVARFATKTGMQSGSQIFTDIKLISRGSDAEFAARSEPFKNASQSAEDPGMNQVVARFRQAAGPRGVTVAGSIASTAEANWLVDEMNQALQHSQSGSGFSPGGQTTNAGPAKAAGALLALAAFALACGIGYWHWRHTHSVPPAPQTAEPSKAAEIPKPAPSTSPHPQPAMLTVAFSSFGTHGECATTGLTVESGDGHADWFVSEASGRLHVIELKIEPVSEPAKRLLVSVAEDDNGVPGKALETFPVAGLTRTNTLGWLDLNSRRQPALKAGTKYWVEARSPGAWYWHFNNQNIIQDSKRPARRKWVGAGHTNVCAFSVLIETNRPSL